MFPQFPNHFLQFPMVFSHVSRSVSTISSGVYDFLRFPPFPILDFVHVKIDKIVLPEMDQ